MRTTVEKPTLESPSPSTETNGDEWRRGIRGLVVSAVVAAGMFTLWWLVATTNSEGHHDAEFLPLFTLIPLVPALYHLWHARR